MVNTIIISNLRVLLIILLLLDNVKINDFLFLLDKDTFNKIKGGSIIKNKIILNNPKTTFQLFYMYITCFFKIKYYLKKNKIEPIVIMGVDHIIGAKFFLRRYPFILIEDGTANYNQKSYVRSWKNRLFSIPVFGMHKNVVKIYLTQEKHIPDIIKHKVESIDIKELWNNKTKDEKEYILSFFDIEIDKLSILKEKKMILFTQPLSEDGILTEEEKVDLYSKIINKYNKDSLVIKPHPRDKTNYKEVFKNVYIFNPNTPSELLDLLNLKFDKVITLFSTAVLQYDEEQVDFYGTVCHSKLKEHFGDIRFFKVNSNL